MTHAREVEDSMRRKDEGRKDKRDEKKERKEDEKRKKQMELVKLKELKREEILEKLKKAEFLGGFKSGSMLQDKALLEKAEKELRTEFIPELYDRTMQKMFGEKYYEDEEEENLEGQKQKKLNLKLLKDEVV